MKRIAVIPARYASTRFEGKPLAPIAGKPMIQHVVERARRARQVERVIVATDDERIITAVNAFGGEALMTSEKNRSGTDRVAETARLLNLAPDDVVINIQGDQPLLAPECLDDLITPFTVSGSDVRMATLGYKIVRQREITDPKDVKVVFDENGDALYFSRAPIPFARDKGTVFDTYKHLGVYAYTREFLDTFLSLPSGRLEGIEKLEQLRALEHGYRIRVVITSHDSLEVDLPEDIPRMETLLGAT